MTDMKMMSWSTVPHPMMGMNNIYLDAMTRVAGLYRESMQANAEQLMISSARIVQEHVMRAMVMASQSCAEELAKNAAALQQQWMTRLAGTNQKAMETMGRAFVDSWATVSRPAQ
jgi:hypothetical protein